MSPAKWRFYELPTCGTRQWLLSNMFRSFPAASLTTAGVRKLVNIGSRASCTFHNRDLRARIAILRGGSRE